MALTAASLPAPGWEATSRRSASSRRAAGKAWVKAFRVTPAIRSPAASKGNSTMALTRNTPAGRPPRGALADTRPLAEPPFAAPARLAADDRDLVRLIVPPFHGGA